MDNGICICTFRKKAEAEEAFCKLKAVADLGMVVSLATAEWCCGLKSTNWAATVGWTSDTIEKFAEIRKTGMGFYAIYAPSYDWHKSENDDVSKNKPEETTTAQGEPINITVSLGSINSDILKALIQALFEDSEKIRDRPVFISII